MYNKGNRMVWIPAFFGLLILISVSTAFVSASPQLPCEFYGTVTISGSPAPAGTVITAYVNSVQQGKIVVKDAGKYGGTGTFDERLIVLAGENDFTGGAPTITFKIGDKVADQTAPYAPGMSTELSMSSGGGSAAASSVSALNGSSGAMQGASIENVSASSVSPVVQVNATPIPPVTAPVVPVITAAPVPVVTVPVVAVVTTAVPQANPVIQNSTPSVSTNLTPTTQIVQAPVIPVITAAPVQAIIAAVSQPANQTVNNTTNTTAAPVNVTPVVSFPSGQTITQ